MESVAIIGFGEAGRAFAGAPAWRAETTGFDIKLLDETTAAEVDAAMIAAGVAVAGRIAQAIASASVLFSVVTADQALTAARSAATHLPLGSLYLDLNSVAPDTKRAAAREVEAAGGCYVDVAVMAPVLPRRLATPLLVAGPHAAVAISVLSAIGFTDVTRVDGPIGAASAIKMIRSVMVKGMEALSAECAIAAHRAGVLDDVITSLDASWPGADWRRRFDYSLDRMMVHGGRRAAEMEESATTLAALGVEPTMTRGTVQRQRDIGKLHVAPPAGVEAKLAVLAPFTTARARADAA